MTCSPDLWSIVFLLLRQDLFIFGFDNLRDNRNEPELGVLWPGEGANGSGHSWRAIRPSLVPWREFFEGKLRSDLSSFDLPSFFCLNPSQIPTVVCLWHFQQNENKEAFLWGQFFIIKRSLYLLLELRAQ